MRRQRVPLGKAAWATRRVSSGIAKAGWGWSDTGGTRGQGQSGGVSGELLGRPWIFPQPQGRKEDGIRHQCQHSLYAVDVLVDHRAAAAPLDHRLSDRLQPLGAEFLGQGMSRLVSW